MNSISRAQFLLGDWCDQAPPLRPPWALAEALFTACCDGCGRCVEVCPQNILRLNRGIPEVDFNRGECTFCGECRAVCAPGALQPSMGSDCENEPEPWPYRAVISGACLSLNGTCCVACIERCEHEAINTTPTLGGRVDIHIDAGACNGCGACVAGCPVNAIAMHH